MLFLYHFCGDIERSLIAAWRKARPVVEVDNADAAILADYAVAAIYRHIQHVGSLVSLSLQSLGIEGDALGITIDYLESELGTMTSSSSMAYRAPISSIGSILRNAVIVPSSVWR